MKDKKTEEKIEKKQLTVQTIQKADTEKHRWLKSKVDEEGKEQNKVVLGDLTGKGMLWLEEPEDKSLIMKEREQQTSRDFINDRLKKLEEHFRTDPQVKEQQERPVSRDLTAERTAWLIDQCSKSPIADERKETITTDLVAGRQKKLEEQFRKVPEMKERDQPTSRLTAERAAWLEEKLKNAYTADERPQPVSTELIAGRLKWLEEQFHKEPEMRGENRRISFIIKERESSTDLFNDRLKKLEEHFRTDPQVKEQQERPISRDLTAERTAWLIDQCSKSPIADEHKETITTNLVAGRQKKLEEQFRKVPEMKERDQPTSRLTAERAAWLEEKWKNTYTTDGNYQPVSTELIAGRLKWLEEQFHKEPEVRGENQPISRDEPSKILSTKGDHEHLSTVPRTGRFKWLREKFQKDKKGKEWNRSFPSDLSETISDNLTAERTARYEEIIKERQVERMRPASSRRSSFLRSRLSCRVQPIM